MTTTITQVQACSEQAVWISFFFLITPLILVDLNFKFGSHFLFIISLNHTKSHRIAFGFVSEHDTSLNSKYLQSESRTAVCMK